MLQSRETSESRGWLTKINDPQNLNGRLFGYELKYQNPDNAPSTKFNGNVSEIDWKTSVDGVLKRYIYNYDVLNRLTAGYYQEPTTSVPVNHFYNEEIAYDLNGNITRLQRNMKGSTNSAEYIDNIQYVYQGNRLISASDATQNFNGYPTGGKPIDYDDNGNMINHKDKDISGIQYNHLNLPYSIKISEGKQGIITKDIQYIYRADGVKVAKKYTPFLGNIETNYLDGFQYDNRETGETSQPLPPSLKFVATSAGYYNFENNKYIYNYTDHLGNVRVSYFKNGNSAEVLEESNYYPFGLKHGISNPAVGNPSYNYKYNGKELQETGMYDYGARMYMPDLGRWGVIDPLTEASRRFTPYHYGNNNPIRFIDPDGRLTVDNLQGGYSTGSAVMDFFDRTGLTDKRNMPLLFRDESGMMVETKALGNDGQGGGGAISIGEILESVGLELNGDISSYMEANVILNLREQIGEDFPNPEKMKAKYDDWKKLVSSNKSSSLSELYKITKTEFREDSNINSPGVTRGNTVFINMKHNPNVLYYAFTLGHEMYGHVFANMFFKSKFSEITRVPESSPRSFNFFQEVMGLQWEMSVGATRYTKYNNQDPFKSAAFYYGPAGQGHEQSVIDLVGKNINRLMYEWKIIYNFQKNQSK
ncbi:RHS repeat domain-containing protein [Chryseobacterium sp. KCF3-3]|uniref:RHS repeat domain-containing protein n=1 Tax=Chryseobacterium sp. KCF3-3 TaxID=3231511 RepID=UPI0038B28976